MNAAESIIEREKRDQPDWFLENAYAITPLIEEKKSGTQEDVAVQLHPEQKEIP